MSHFVVLTEGTEAGRREAPALCVDGPSVDRHAIHDAATLAAVCLFDAEGPLNEEASR